MHLKRGDKTVTEDRRQYTADEYEYCRECIPRLLTDFAEKNKKGYIPAKEAIFKSWELVINGLSYIAPDPGLRVNYLMSQLRKIKEMVDTSAKDRDELGLKYVLRLLEKSISLKDQSMQTFTYGVNIHSDNVAMCSVTVARALGFSDEKRSHIYIGAKLHDVGKVAIPDSILTKPNKLTEEEYGIVKGHPVVGEEILDVTDFIFKVPFLEKIRSMVGQHHEHYFGGGYPGRVQGDDISLCARIVTICDAFDAMTYGRPHAERKTPDKALEEICHNPRGQFDPDVAMAAKEALERAYARMKRPA